MSHWPKLNWPLWPDGSIAIDQTSSADSVDPTRLADIVVGDQSWPDHVPGPWFRFLYQSHSGLHRRQQKVFRCINWRKLGGRVRWSKSETASAPQKLTDSLSGSAGTGGHRQNLANSIFFLTLLLPSSRESHRAACSTRHLGNHRRHFGLYQNHQKSPPTHFINFEHN